MLVYNGVCYNYKFIYFNLYLNYLNQFFVTCLILLVHILNICFSNNAKFRFSYLTSLKCFDILFGKTKIQNTYYYSISIIQNVCYKLYINVI